MNARLLRLWYRQPAREWTEALPIGTGRLGAMVFGGIETETLQLNEVGVANVALAEASSNAAAKPIRAGSMGIPCFFHL